MGTCGGSEAGAGKAKGGATAPPPKLKPTGPKVEESKVPALDRAKLEKLEKEPWTQEGAWDAIRKDDSSCQQCFDCGKADPEWAATKHGVLVCAPCCGMHRSQGTHVSVIRSVKMDLWTPQQLKPLTCGGNARAAAFFAKHLVPRAIPGDQPSFASRYSHEGALMWRDSVAAAVNGKDFKEQGWVRPADVPFVPYVPPRPRPQQPQAPPAAAAPKPKYEVKEGDKVKAGPPMMVAKGLLELISKESPARYLPLLERLTAHGEALFDSMAQKLRMLLADAERIGEESAAATQCARMLRRLWSDDVSANVEAVWKSLDGFFPKDMRDPNEEQLTLCMIFLIAFTYHRNKTRLGFEKPTANKYGGFGSGGIVVAAAGSPHLQPQSQAVAPVRQGAREPAKDKPNEGPPMEVAKGLLEELCKEAPEQYLVLLGRLTAHGEMLLGSMAKKLCTSLADAEKLGEGPAAATQSATMLRHFWGGDAGLDVKVGEFWKALDSFIPNDMRDPDEDDLTVFSLFVIAFTYHRNKTRLGFEKPTKNKYGGLGSGGVHVPAAQ